MTDSPDDRGRPGAPAPSPGSSPSAGPGSDEAGASGPGLDPGGAGASRPLVERLGLAAVALAIAGLFGAVAAFSWAGGEAFLAVMAGLGAVMTAWAGANSLRRG